MDTERKTPEQNVKDAQIARGPAGANSYRDRHGKVRWRYRRQGISVCLPGQPGEERFEAAYQAALGGSPIRQKANLPRYAPLGVIYAIQGPVETPVKIGFSRSETLLERLAVIQTGNPYELRIIAQASGFPRHERQAHAALATYRMAGEWFAWCPAVSTFVGGMPAGIASAIEALARFPSPTRSN